MSNPQASPNSCADLIARYLLSQRVTRVFALCGGHIMPIWMRLHAHGIQIIDVRDERAAVFMAHAHAELTGTLGVALVTAGPGVTNATTGIANAYVARASVLVLSGVPPLPQENRGALQDIAHPDILKSITRYARTIRHPDLLLAELDEACSRCVGEGGEAGPVFVDVPVDIQRAKPHTAVGLPERFHLRQKSELAPHTIQVQKAVDLLWSAKRPLVITGRGARGCGTLLADLLERTGSVYLDTSESRGLIPDEHPAQVGALRGSVMAQADVVLLLGRKLDFQLAFGSPAVFKNARLIRVADNAAELRDNRRGEVEILASVKPTIAALLTQAGDRVSSTERAEWQHALHQKHCHKAAAYIQSMRTAPAGNDGLMHPNTLLAALNDALGSKATVIADGGDFLSFARVGLSATRYLDPGPLGCIGIGTPFGIAAALLNQDEPVVVATGDGAFGFNAMEICTAARHQAPLLIVVANNGAWAIEVRDQAQTHGQVVGTRLQFADYAAMARALGLHAERVTRADDLPMAIQRALANRPALLDVLVTPEAASSDAKSGLAWVPDLQALAAWDQAELQWREGHATNPSQTS